MIGNRLLGLNNSTSSSLKQGLISCWELNEASGSTAYDSWGNNDLINTSAGVNGVGKIEGAYVFDGVLSKLTLADSSQFQGLPSVSVSVWCKPTVVATPYGMIVSKLHSFWGNPYYQFQLRTYGANEWDFLIGTNSTYNGAGYISPINVGQWYFVVGVYNGVTGAIQVYVNNVSSGTTTIAGGGALGNATSGLVIGDDVDLFANFKKWNGLIDQVSIWNRVLSTEEITQLYNSGNGLAYTNW